MGATPDERGSDNATAGFGHGWGDGGKLFDEDGGWFAGDAYKQYSTAKQTSVIALLQSDYFSYVTQLERNVGRTMAIYI